MSDAFPRQPGMPWLSPYLTVTDVEKMVTFYQKAFGFEAGDLIKEDDGSVSHAEMKFKEAMIMMGPEGAYGSTAKAPKTLGTEPSLSLYLYCDDVDALHEQAVAAGAQCIMPPEDMFWQDRMAKYVDPDGYQWSFATAIKAV